MREQETHPTYGLMQISRCTGGNQNFFGTGVKQQHYFELRLHEGAREVTEFGDERFSPKGGRIPFVSVKMTAHQFSELITTMNIGEGVPCTISTREYVSVGQCPSQTSPINSVIDKAHEGVLRTEEQLSGYLDEVMKIVSKDSVNKKDREEIKKLVSIINGRMKSNTDFYSKQIEEVGEKVITNAKTEIEAVITSKVFQFGLEELNRMKLNTEKEQNKLGE